MDINPKMDLNSKSGPKSKMDLNSQNGHKFKNEPKSKMDLNPKLDLKSKNGPKSKNGQFLTFLMNFCPLKC